MLPSESSLPIARRATWRDTECLELVCGIANAGGGRLILDADVDSRGAVKRRTSRLMKTIPGLIAQSLNLTCAVELVLDSGRFCLEVVIPPANDPISFRGIFFFYKDGENHILDDEALDRLMQRDMEVDVKWEQRPVVQASLDDLNMGLVTRFTGAARDTDLTVDLDEASAIEQTLRHAGLMTGVGTPTNAGILLLHNRPHQYIPGATVRIGFFGSHGGTPIYEDEVFGSLGPDDAPFREDTPYAPNSPYSASKAASDHLARAFCHTYGLPVLVTNCSNNYGPRQFPEKLIPLFISRALAGEPMPLYGSGQNVRDWLYVEEHCEALERVLGHGLPGRSYNIGGNCERSNLELVDSLCRALDSERPRPAGSYRELVRRVADRPGHDWRYAMDTARMRDELGWQPRVGLEEGMLRTVRWYLEHEGWMERARQRAAR